ncbi:unnamed protein product [Orchesella dallaii]|uniref:SCP domain-containing protein n=1 Tax=Orchesella dallaii TaxID=48710 RepID=A0ABP1PIG8_9HEXA
MDDQWVKQLDSCYLNLNFKEDEWQSRYDYHSDFQKQYESDPEKVRTVAEMYALKYLKVDLKNFYLIKLPSAYKSICEEFIDNENQEPAKDYSTILQDSLNGDYPFRGLAHCLIGAIEENHKADDLVALDENQKPAKDYYAILQDSSKGDYPFRGLAHCLMGAIEENNKADDFVALNSYWLKPKPFLEAFIDRENKNRARHGVPMLTLDTELSLRAQRYADEIARICDIVHMIDNPKYGADHPDHQYNGGWTGENLGKTATTYLTDSDNGVDVANTFYSEIKDYPWPEYTGNNADYLKIGHFTQSVWKSTTLAGYGITRNESCPVFKVYIVARYFPAGNRMTYYKDNVLPPIY